MKFFRKKDDRVNMSDSNFVREYRDYCIRKIHDDMSIKQETKRQRIAVVDRDFRMVNNGRMLPSDFIKKNSFRFI